MKINFARYYASIGIKVFPCYTIINGKCSCGHDDCHSPGKHPMTANGMKDATIDIIKIEQWWKQNPEANIAGVMGIESGMIAIDFDDMDWFKYQGDITLDLPETPIQETGKGLHYIYKYPVKEDHVPTGKQIGGFPIDSRADGGYIMLAPSDHISGKSYRWKIGLDVPLSECPEWWLRLLKEKKEKPRIDHTAEKIQEGGRNDTLFTYAFELFLKEKYVYDEVDAMVFGLNAMKCVPPLDHEEIKQIVKSAYNRKMKIEEENRELLSHCDIDSVRENLKKKVAVELLSKTKTKRKIIKPNFMPERGLIRDIAEHIISQSERPLPTLAVAASISFIGALAGRKYQTDTKLGPNVVFVGVAGSGHGKGKAPSILDSIALKCGNSVSRRMGASKFASGQAIASSLSESPSQLFVIDEIGLFLQSITSNNSAAYKREIAENIMIMYSSYGKTYRGTAYSDNKNRPRKDIFSPCLCLYGVSTPETLYPAFNSGHGEDGFLARLLIVDDGEERPERVTPRYEDVPAPLIDKIRQLAEYRPSVGAIVDNSDSEPEMMRVPIDRVSYESYIDIDEAMGNAERSGMKSSIYSRVAENAMKLALIHAISIDYRKPHITMESWQWGCDIAIYCAEKLLEIIEKHVSDNDFEKWCKKIIHVMEKYGKNGLSAAKIQYHVGNSMKKSAREEYLSTMIDSMSIVLHEGKYYLPEEYKKLLDSVDKVDL